MAADARLLEAASLEVAEASLTGESEPVLKDAATLSGPVSLGDRFDMVFSGTAVASGRGRAVVTATGMDTEVGHIARLLGHTEEERTLQADGNIVAMTGDGVNDAPDHVGRFLGDVGAGDAHGEADVGRAQGPGRRQLRHHRGRGARGAGDLRRHPQLPALPAVVERRRGV